MLDMDAKGKGEGGTRPLSKSLGLFRKREATNVFSAGWKQYRSCA